jgi:hypothetical protein
MSARKGHTLLTQLVVSGEVPFALTVYNYKAEQLKLKGAPIDFKQYIAGAADATGAGSDPGDKCAPRIFVDKIDPRGYAIGGVFDCGGARLMWARRSDGLWRQIWGGQITPDCPTMKKYEVPAAIAGKVCWDVKKQKEIPYER